MHVESGRDVAGAGVDLLVAVGGADADALVEGALGAGLEPSAVRRAPDAVAALEIARAEIQAGDRVLVKGSRAMGMERVVQGLCDWSPAGGEGG